MRFIEELEGLVSNQFGVIKTCLSMTKLEARLAALSVFPLLINLCLLLVCLTSVWMTMMCILGYMLMQAFNSPLIAMGGVFLFNTILLAALIGYLMFNLNSMGFTKTRAFLSRNKEPEVNEPTKAGEDRAGNTRKKIIASTSTDRET